MEVPHPSGSAPNPIRDLAHRWFEEVWVRREESAIHELLHPECRIHGVSTDVLVGPADFLPFWRMSCRNYTGISIRIEDCVVDGDWVSVFISAESLHMQSFNEVAITGCATFKVEEGICVETHHVFDYLSVLGRCGAVEDLDAFEAIFPLSDVDSDE